MSRAGQNKTGQRTLADMSIPPEDRGRKVKVRAKTPVPAQLNHGNSAWGRKRRREGERKLARDRDMGDRASRWQRGECDIYARALVQEYPQLRFGVAATECEDVLHFFAHDGTTAYDSLGAHPMPYLGARGRFHHVLADIRPGRWGLAGAADEDVMRKAAAHIRRHQTGPTRVQAEPAP